MPYPTFTAAVTSGLGRGRELDYPTVNLVIPDDFTLDVGVYACRIPNIVIASEERAKQSRRDRHVAPLLAMTTPSPLAPACPAGRPRHSPLPAVLFLGTRQTMGIPTPTLEVHFIDSVPEEPLTTLTVEIIAHIRSPQKFSSLNELKRAIARDIDAARRILTDR